MLLFVPSAWFLSLQINSSASKIVSFPGKTFWLLLLSRVFLFALLHLWLQWPKPFCIRLQQQQQSTNTTNNNRRSSYNMIIELLCSKSDGCQQGLCFRWWGIFPVVRSCVTNICWSSSGCSAFRNPSTCSMFRLNRDMFVKGIKIKSVCVPIEKFLTLRKT